MRGAAGKIYNLWMKMKHPWLLIRKFLSINFYSKTFLPLKSPLKYQSIHLLNKIKKQHTWTTNKYFLSLIFLACLITAATTYFERSYKFKQDLRLKTQLVHNHIIDTIKAYHISLTGVAQLLIKDKRYLDYEKTLHILKLSFVTDKNIKLLPVIWHPLAEPNKSISSFGAVTSNTNKRIIQRLKQNINLFIVYDKLFSSPEEISLIIIDPVVEFEDLIKSINHQLNQKQKLIGYLELQVKASTILQGLYEKLEDSDILRIINQEKILYFTKQRGMFQINQSPHLKNHQFPNELNFAPYDYKISVSQSTHNIILDTINNAAARIAIILIIGSLMMFIYNFLEQKRAKNSYSNELKNEFSAMQEQILTLSTELDLFKQKDEQYIKAGKNQYISAKLITSLEQQIYEPKSAALLKIKNCNHLILKHYSKEKELSPNVLESLFESIYQKSEDLLDNIFNREDSQTEVDLANVISEILSILSPIITQRSVFALKKVEEVKLKINDIIFKQILLSLLARVLYFAPKNNEITISAYKVDRKDSIKIEIIDNGTIFNELLFQDFLYKKQNNLFAGMTNILLRLETIESLVREFKGDLRIDSDTKGNHITLLLPISYNPSNKIIHINKIVRESI